MKAQDMGEALFPHHCMDIIVDVYGGRWEYIKGDTLYKMVGNLMGEVEPDIYAPHGVLWGECVAAVENHINAILMGEL